MQRIKNTSELAKTRLRKDVLKVIEAGLDAIDTCKIIQRSVIKKGDLLKVGGQTYDLKKYKNIFVIGIGKASNDACAGLEKILGNRITAGIVLDIKSAKFKKLKSLTGTHPLPSVRNMRATGEIVGILKGLTEHDLLIAVISGGGSALLCQPHELKCSELSLLTKVLMQRGAEIGELNAVRKHLSEIQGGQLAQIAYPATILGLIFSDVPGDDLSMVASGPTVMDLTTVEDAKRIMDKYSLLKACNLPNCHLRETPKDPIYFRRVANITVANNVLALDAMKNEIKRLGYKCRIYSRTLTGEAREVGRLLAGLPQSGEMVLSAGETTVTIKGKGKGGRNQEVALGALLDPADDFLVASIASDGFDNSPVAGAIADALIKKKSAELKMKPEKYLSQNDSFAFFRRVGGHIATGITGANVSDLFLSARLK